MRGDKLDQAIALSGKINDILTEHYEKSWSMRNKGRDDYFSLNEKLIKKVQKVFKDYQLAKERYGK